LGPLPVKLPLRLRKGSRIFGAIVGLKQYITTQANGWIPSTEMVFGEVVSKKPTLRRDALNAIPMSILIRMVSIVALAEKNSGSLT